MRGQRMERFAGGLWPPREAAFREALEAQPKALTIIDQQLQCGASPVAKQKHGPRKWIVVKTVAAERGKGINAFAKIHRLIREHDLELWRELDHDLETKKS